MELKTFIVSLNKDNAFNIAKELIKVNDSLSITPYFTTDNEYKNEVNENYIYYLGVDNVNLSYKNNALLYIKTNNYISSGITIDDFYNNDICFMNIEEFNMISEVIFKKYNVLIIWIDSINHKQVSPSEMIEVNYFSNFIENHDYLYFLENETNICKTIIDYIFGDDEIRQELLKENN